MAVRFPVRGGRTRAPRRKTTWLEIESTSTTLTSAGGTTLNVLTAAEAAKRPFTIIRTHLELMVQSDQFAASEFQVGALGIVVVSDQARAIGVTAIPTPVTDAGSDMFFLHQWFMSNFTFVSSVGFSEGRAAANFYTVDSKAMRKVNDDQDVMVVAEMDPSVGSGLILHVSGRLLIKEN